MRTEFLAKTLRFFVYAAAFVPLIIFSDFLSPFHFGKVVVFRSLVEVAVVLYFVLALRERAYRPRWDNPLLVIFGLFTFVFGVSTALSINPYLSFWGSIERMGGFWTFTHYFAYFIILTSVFKKREDWLRLLKVMVFTGVLSALYGFGQKTDISFFVGSGGRTRIFGTIGNAALFAGYQVVTLFAVLALAVSGQVPPRQRGYLYVAALISVVAIIMTAVRGSVLALVAGFILMAILTVAAFNSSKAKKILIGILAVIVLFLVFSFSFKNSGFVKNSPYLRRITDTSINSYTVQTRFWAWRAGIDGWGESAKTVILGWGPENFNVPFSKNFNPKFFQGSGSETLFDRAHNMFVEILVTMGLLAFLVYISLFVVAFRLIWKRLVKNNQVGGNRMLGIGLISLLAAYMIHNSFIFDTSANFIAFFTVLGFISWLTSRDGELTASSSESPVTTSRLTMSYQALAIVLLLGSAFLIYRTNVLQSKANYAATRAIVRSWGGDHNGAVTKFQEAISYDVPGKYDYRHRYAQYLLETYSGKKIGEPEAALLQSGIEEVQKNADENPQDYLPHLYISRFYIVLGKSDPKSPYNDEALKSSFKALEISPTFVRTYYEIAQGYLNKKDYGNAIKYFDQAAKLNPEVGQSYWYLAATYFEKGDTALGLEAVDNARRAGHSFSEPDLLRLVGFYDKLGDFEELVRVYRDLAGINPNNPQYHASLAVAYSRVGDIDKAVEQARIAAQLDASFEAEARAFVQSLGRKF